MLQISYSGRSSAKNSSKDVSAAGTMVALIAFAMVFAGLAEHQWQKDVTPFTLQEWLWAAKGGYLDTMIAHFIRNGGL